MFLSRLDSAQKEAFLQLCVHAALSNNVFADEQNALIGEYCKEMQVEEYEVAITTDLNELLDEMMEITGNHERRIIAFETIGLLLSDNTYDDLEQGFVALLQEKLKLSDATIAIMIDLIARLRDVYKDIAAVVLAEE